MKNSVFTLLITLILTGILFSQQFSPAITDAKRLIYDDSGEFREGFCSIKKGNKWGFMDTSGNIVLDFKYELSSWQIGWLYFQNGLCRIPTSEQGKKVFIYIDTNFKEVIKLTDVADATDFSGDRALVFPATKPSRLYFIDKSGKEVAGSSKNYNFIAGIKPLVFSEGAYVYFDPGKSKYIYVDNKGKQIINGEFEDAMPFSEGLAAVQTLTNTNERKWGFIDINGNVVIDYKFSEKPGDFSEGLASVTDRQFKKGYINTKGEVVVKPAYNAAYPYFMGHALTTDLNGTYLIDTVGNVVKNLGNDGLAVLGLDKERQMYTISLGVGYVFGTMTPMGEMIFPPSSKTNETERVFPFMTPFYSDRAYARAYIGNSTVEGFIDIKGNFVIIREEEQF
ncbi:MAG: WG repeat-containing protein [Ignavibacteriaceae bacterium]|nr:WG repeat-containing protein [Ignavibacteriaceae bacterium]